MTTNQFAPVAAAATDDFAAQIAAVKIPTRQASLTQRMKRNAESMGAAILMGTGSVIRNTIRFANFIGRVQVPGRYNRRPGTGNIIPNVPWVRSLAAGTHRTSLKLAAVGGGSGAVVAVLLTAASYAIPAIDNEMQKPYDLCVTRGIDALGAFPARYAAMTKLTGTHPYVDSTASAGITAACQQDPNMDIASAVSNRRIASVDTWARGYDTFYQDALVKKRERDAYYEGVARHLAEVERDMPARRAAAEAYQAQLIAAHRPHPAPEQPTEERIPGNAS